MAAQEGQCPTCGNNITIPILDRYGRLIDPKTRQIIKQDPHPFTPTPPPASARRASCAAKAPSNPAARAARR
jgi:hypothetical protein